MNMCFRKIIEWFKPNEEQPPLAQGDRVLLSFAINDYPGTQNDLNGCVNDQVNADKTLSGFFPDFVVEKHKDSAVTRAMVKSRMREYFKQKWDTVILLMDCCFSEDNTKGCNPNPIKSRYAITVKRSAVRKIRRRIMRSTTMNWIAFSACQDYQTAADAFISGSYNGAFTWFAMKTLHPSLTYREWALKTKTALRDSSYEQISEIQGPDALLDKKVFSDRTLVIHYSGHGTTVKGGTEPDGQDEAMYVYDGIILDDEMADILAGIMN